MRRVKTMTRVAATLLALLLVVPAAVPMTVQAEGTDTVYVTKTGEKYHARYCKYVKNKNNISTMTKDQARSRGLTACSVCSGGIASSSSSSGSSRSSSSTSTATTTSTTTTAAAQTPTNVAATTTQAAAQDAAAQAAAAQALAVQSATATAAAAASSTTTTAEQAVQQAYAMYVQNGMDSSTALARVNSKLAEFVAQPGSIAQIVQNDLASLTSANAATSAATGLTAADAVQQAYALYVQSGMDSNSALARVNSKLAEFAAQPNAFAQIVQNDLASAGTTVTAAAAGISVNDAVQQAYALCVQNGLNSDTAFARVQGLLTQIVAQPDSYAQIVANDLAAQH